MYTETQGSAWAGRVQHNGSSADSIRWGYDVDYEELVRCVVITAGISYGQWRFGTTKTDKLHSRPIESDPRLWVQFRALWEFTEARKFGKNAMDENGKSWWSLGFNRRLSETNVAREGRYSAVCQCSQWTMHNMWFCISKPLCVRI